MTPQLRNIRSFNGTSWLIVPWLIVRLNLGSKLGQ